MNIINLIKMNKLRLGFIFLNVLPSNLIAMETNELTINDDMSMEIIKKKGKRQAEDTVDIDQDTKKPKTSMIYQEAESLFRSGKYQDALIAFQSIHQNPQFFGKYEQTYTKLFIGKICEKNNDHEAALNYYKSAKNLSLDIHVLQEVYFHIGYLYYITNRHNEALHALQFCIEERTTEPLYFQSEARHYINHILFKQPTLSIVKSIETPCPKEITLIKVRAKIQDFHIQNF